MCYCRRVRILNVFIIHRYCSEHSRKAQISRIKSTSRRSLQQTPEMLLLNLSHYVKPTDSSAEDTEEESGKVKVLDPFSKYYISVLCLSCLRTVVILHLALFTLKYS